MKHQYFGDIIDLFKFDLLAHTAMDLRLGGITFIPMRTDNDNTTEGSKRNYDKAKAGAKNKTLIEFLKGYEELSKRDAKEISKFFASIKVQFKYCCDETFTHKGREIYFSKLLGSSFDNQLLFFDPDNGLQVKNNKDKHLLFHEIESFLNVICENSIIAVIQFRHRQDWKITIQKKLEDIRKNVSPLVTYIANDNIAFFMITKSEKQLSNIQQSLTKYKSVYTTLI